MSDVESRARKYLIAAPSEGLSFVLAFCSLGYQLLLARCLGQFEDNEILVFSLTIGLHLLFMGVGSALASRLKVFKTAALNLLSLEILLSILGATAVTYVTIWMIFAELTTNLMPFATAIRFLGLVAPVALIGFLTGLEIPWLIELKGSESSTRILIWNYLGAFSAAIVIPLWAIPHLPLVIVGIAVSLLNLLAAAILLPYAHLKRKYLLPILTSFVLAITLQQGSMSSWASLEQALLKTSYLGIRLERWTGSWNQWLITLDGFQDIERIVTPYQMIDIIPNGFMRSEPTDKTFSVYLNMQPQFSADNIAVYHESMIHGAIALASKSPRKALILGGGDGLLARELLKRNDISEITLVELDHQMIQVANIHPTLRQYNKGALQDPRVRVIVDDAFAWLRRQEGKWDAIFIDFPFPVNYELNKLYSLEFYQAVIARLEHGGFFVLDAPIWQTGGGGNMPTPSPQDILFSTLQEAGVRHWMLYGPYEPFLFASIEAMNADFQESSWNGVEISNKTSMNLTPLTHLMSEADVDQRWVNRVFRPRRMRW